MARDAVLALAAFFLFALPSSTQKKTEAAAWAVCCTTIWPHLFFACAIAVGMYVMCVRACDAVYVIFSGFRELEVGRSCLVAEEALLLLSSALVVGEEAVAAWDGFTCYKNVGRTIEASLMIYVDGKPTCRNYVERDIVRSMRLPRTVEASCTSPGGWGINGKGQREQTANETTAPRS